MSRLYIQEVGPRDGLQIEPRFLETPKKIALIDDLSRCGFAKIEVTSFVSPRRVPNLADAAHVTARIRRDPSVVYVALVPNLRGTRNAIAAEMNEINLVMSASETHNRENMGMDCEHSLMAFAAISPEAQKAGVALNGSIATAFGCPFEGPQAPARVLGFVERYLSLGFGGITLADTTGMANPAQVKSLVKDVLSLVEPAALTLHFHNTRGMGLANAVAAADAGAVRFDASVGGIGGCPFAPGATGNVCTEDLVHMFEAMGVPTGVDLSALILISQSLSREFGRELPGQVAKAGRATDLHAVPSQPMMN
ncbi:MAG: hydroxymethylglutaryl-CoA lyase [Pseudolabrys sp.]